MHWGFQDFRRGRQPSVSYFINFFWGGGAPRSVTAINRERYQLFSFQNRKLDKFISPFDFLAKILELNYEMLGVRHVDPRGWFLGC